MRRRPGRWRRIATSAALAAATAATLVAGTPAASTAAGPAFPAHVFAPYFETYAPDDPATLAARSGARYLSLAFLQVPQAGGCQVTWNGDTSQPVAPSVYGPAIAAIRARGGDVIATFGGYSADHSGLDIADSCPSVRHIAASYEDVVATYGLRRIDLDVEDASLTSRAGIHRRNAAVVLLQRWAASTHRPLQVSYTLPATTTGLDADGLVVITDAHRRGVRLDVVNIMTFDYFDGRRHDMRAAAENGATGLVRQLGHLLPGRMPPDLWGRVGVTTMIGVDDAGDREILTPAAAVSLRRWATARGVDTLSFWALQRDNGGCPGGPPVDTCSGITQSRWQFTNAFAPFD